MSLNLIPGYDFGLNEVVDRNKLMAWIAGIDQSGALNGSDLGIVFTPITVAATMSTAVTEAVLRIDSTVGLLQINTRWGFVPIGLTQGQFFTRRIKDQGNLTATARVFHGIWAASIYGAGSPAVACPVSSYSAGEHLSGYGMALSNLVLTANGSGTKNFCMGNMWPTIEHHLADGTLTFASSATFAQHLVSFGGWGPWCATCANTSNYTAPLMVGTADYDAHGSSAFQTGGGYVLVHDAPGRMGELMLAGGVHSMQMAWSYPHWGASTRTPTLTRHF